MGQDERHYNINKLNKIFAISSIILLAGIIALFAKDYVRDWKKVQKKFRTIEVEKARVKFDKASLELEKNPEYLELVDQFNKLQEKVAAICVDDDSISKQILELKATDDLAVQQYKFAKAELDAIKYTYEGSKAHNSETLEEDKALYEDYKIQVAALKLDTEKSNLALSNMQKQKDACDQSLRDLEKQKNKVSLKRDLLKKKLEGIDFQEMSAANIVADMVRDLPILDLANPRNKIEQVVLNDIREDVNFMSVPKVERCVTCHLGITNSDYKNEVQPYKAHPNLELYVGNNSPHPIEEFGCTVCHGGRARGTDFNGTAHTPNSKQQEKEWKEKHNWEKIHLWEEPMLPMKYVEAGCFKCHSGESAIKGAEKLNLGLHIIEKAGCYNCHLIDKYEDWPKSGPNLQTLSSKVDENWAYKWIYQPQSFRHNTWMPHYFNQDNNSDPESIERSQQEVKAIVHYLFQNSTEYNMELNAPNGDSANGEKLIASVGCMACHQIQPEKIAQKTYKELLHKQHGPNLIGLGSKTSKEWLYHWLKNPSSYHATTRMPDLRLNDQEAADIAEYLHKNKNIEFENLPVPEVNEEIVNNIVTTFLSKNNTSAQTESELAKMQLDEKLDFAGKKLISQYGCYSCHDIKGFDESAKPIGVELTHEGGKSTHKLDFGFIHIEHTNYAWFDQKLKAPRIFDNLKEKAPDEKLIMPNFYLEQDQIDAVVTALLGFVDDDTVSKKIKPRTTKNKFIEEGQKLVRQFNCQACHKIEGNGGGIASNVEDWLINHKEKSDSEANVLAESYSPPDLHGVGAKLDPQWLFNFLHEPKQEIRPWIEVRMPSYGFNAAHLNALVKYFNYLDDEEFPFYNDINRNLTKKEYAAAEELFGDGPNGFNCTQCHVVGNKLPSGEADSWAPNLALAKTRLKPEWLLRWIKNPTAIQPGTKMPTFYDPEDFENAGPPNVLDGDENAQIYALRKYILSLADKDEASKSKPSKEIVETPQPSVAEPLQEAQ